jgi:hypothetical protein
MKKFTSLLLALSFGASVAFADTPPGPPPGAGPGGPHHPPRDCSKAPNDEMKARCEARQKAVESCKDKQGEERKQCVMAAMPKMDKQ